MDIQTRKIEFIQEFLKLKNEELISRLERLLCSERVLEGKDSQPMSIGELNERIDKSLEDSRNSRLTKSGDLIAEIKKWG